jgi:hypothetical protein
MRENRPYGSEGGEAKAFPTPIRRTESALRSPGSPRRFAPRDDARPNAASTNLASADARKSKF